MNAPAARRVTAAVIEQDGKVLLALRKRGSALAGKWEFPGGKVEPGETPQQCLRRELMEELGVDTRIEGFVCASRFEYKHMEIELLVYRAARLSGEFTAREHERLEWAEIKDLQRYDLSAADIPVAAFLRAELR